MATARAVYSNTADTAEELSFSQGEILRVLEVDVGGLAGWWLCSLRGRTGIAPGNRLQLISPGSCPSPSRRSSERCGTPDMSGGGRGTLSVCGGGRRTPDISDQRSCRGGSAVSPLARQDGLSRSGSFRQQATNRTCDQSSTYDTPQLLSAHQDLQDYDVPSVRYQGEGQHPPTRPGARLDHSACNYDSPATLRHEYDTLRDIREMSRALNEIQSAGLMADSSQNYDSPLTLKRDACSEQNYDSPQTLLTIQEQNYDSPLTLLANSQLTYQTPQSLRSCQVSSRYSLQSCRDQRGGCGSPRQASNDVYDSPMNLIRNSPIESINDVYDSPFRNSPCPVIRREDSPHTLTRAGSKSQGQERSCEGSASPLRVTDVSNHAFTNRSSHFRDHGLNYIEHISGGNNQCDSPKEHCAGIGQRQQLCHMGEYDVPGNVSAARCSGGVLSILSNRSSVLSSVGSRSSACSGSSPSGSARSSAEVYELNPLESSALRGCNVQVGNIRSGGGETSQIGKPGRAYQQQQQQLMQQSSNIYDNRDSYLDDYSVPRSDSSVDSGISVQSGANEQPHDNISNNVKTNQQVAGEYDVPSQLVYPSASSSSATSPASVPAANSLDFHSSSGNSGSYNVSANHRKPPAVKPKPKSKMPERFASQGRPLPAPPSYTSVVPDDKQSSSSRVTPGQDERTRLGGSSDNGGSKADISVIVSDSASEWNDDCDYVTIANDAELEVKKKVEEARSGNHFNARLASDAFNSRVNRPIDGITSGAYRQQNESSRLPGGATLKNSEIGKFTFQVHQAEKLATSNGNSKVMKNSCSTSAGGLSDKFKERLDAVKKATNMTGDTPSGRVSANIEPVVEFYASQADVIFTEVQAAAGEFFNCEGTGNTDAGSFARRGRNVILAAHKLVYVSDAMARLGTLSCEEPGSTAAEGEGVGEIVQAANTLCESLKAAVVATRNAALLYPDATSRQRAEDCILSAVAECAELCDVIHANATHLLVG